MTNDTIKVKRFSVARIMAVTGRILMQFRRDHRTFAMMILMPLLFMLVFGLVLSGDIKHVNVMIDNQDEGFTNPSTGEEFDLGGDILDSLIQDERTDVITGVYDDGIDQVEDGEIVAVIRFDANFTGKFLLDGSATIFIYIDGTKPQIKGAVYGALQDALQEVSEGRGITLDETLAYEGAEYSGLDVSIPAVMGYILTFLILLISVLTVIREDIGKTKLRLFTTPLTRIERILGYVLALSIFAVLETALVLAIAILVFDTVVKGSLTLLFISGFIYGLSNIFLAFLLSNMAQSEFQAVQLAVLVAIPSLAFSGMMIPISSLPGPLAAISRFIPLTYAIEIFEGIMLKGWGIEKLTFQFTLIIVLAVVFFFLAILSSIDHSKD